MKKNTIIVIGLLIAVLIVGFIANAQGGKFVRIWPDLVSVYKLMSSPDEFVSEGGDWNNIETIGNEQIFGSVGDEGNNATTTLLGVGAANIANDSLLKNGPGVLSSIIVAKAGTAGGWLSLYNATTTDITKRTGAIATSTITLATIPLDLAAGTYTYDIAFSKALSVSWVGTIGTSTITWK